jgi:serine/threonine protein kinase
MIKNDISDRPVDHLDGIDLEGGWHVERKKDIHPASTGGTFSVGYIVKNKSGKKAFLKAVDLSAASQAEDPTLELQNLLEAFNFERDLLQKCIKCNRIVTPISSGHVNIFELGVSGLVPYLIFEYADYDIRSGIANWKEFDVAWALRSLHNSTTGLQQLHQKKIAHQDLKPSNILYFKNEGTKLSDLGRASYENIRSENDKKRIAGDITYAAPELFYNWSYNASFDKRFMADIYQLGSLIFFFFIGTSAKSILRLILSENFSGKFKPSNFEEDLPYFQHAFNKSLEMLSNSNNLPEDDKSKRMILQIARELCDPDPQRRGNPKTLATVIPRWDLQTYISRFNLLARIAEKKLFL